MFEDLVEQECADSDNDRAEQEARASARLDYHAALKAVDELAAAARPFWQVPDAPPTEHTPADIAALVAAISGAFGACNEAQHQRLVGFDWEAARPHHVSEPRPFEAMERIVKACGVMTPEDVVPLTSGRLRQAFCLLVELMRGVLVYRNEVAGVPVEVHPWCLWVREGLRMVPSDSPTATKARKETQKPGKRKGKNIDARMLKVLSENKESFWLVVSPLGETIRLC